MSKFFLRAPWCPLWLVLLFVAVTNAQEWKKIPIPTLPAFHPQEPKRVELPNGMVIFLQEDHELPFIDMTARIRGGSRVEPATKTGLVSLYGEVWRTGGTKSETGDQLDDYLEIRAAKVETGGNADSTTIGLSSLKEDFNDVFKVFTDLLRDPEFRADKLELAKREAADSISRRNDEASQVAAREAAKLAYGKDNPYVREPEYATVDAVTRQDLVDWHNKYVYPNNIILGVAGDFDPAQMEAKLRAAFASWAKGPAVKPPDIQFTPAKPGYYLIKREDVNQSWIRMVTLGTTRRNPDYYAIEVFNEAFGGGFSARLIQNIRTAQGLAYAVGGGISTRFDHPGITQLAMATKSESTVKAINSLFEQIDLLKTSKPVTDEEIKRAKDTILNNFVFNFDTPGKVLQERMAYEYYGYPPDFLEQYRAGIEKVTTADVARVANKYLHKDQLAVLVTGNAADFDKPLSSLGSVQNVDITIPPPPGSATQQGSEKPTSNDPAAQGKKESNPEGKALVSKVVQALGGAEKLNSVKSVKSKFTVDQKSGQMPGQIQAESSIVYPDHMKLDMTMPQGSFSIVVTPAAAFVESGGQVVQELPPSRRDESMAQIHRDLIYIAQHASDPAFAFAASGSEKSGDTDTAIVDVSGPGVDLRWFVDPQSGKVVRETYQAMGRSGPENTETAFSDWRPVNGLNLPFHRANKQNGQDASTTQFTSFELNPQVDPKIFEKPASAPQQ
ncbi:MAG TPA: pitrilysin family protein [Terriglobales bacterium]|nr:pitrilysin family protein [Terriglobales bacterium]